MTNHRYQDLRSRMCRRYSNLLIFFIFVAHLARGEGESTCPDDAGKRSVLEGTQMHALRGMHQQLARSHEAQIRKSQVIYLAATQEHRGECFLRLEYLDHYTVGVLVYPENDDLVFRTIPDDILNGINQKELFREISKLQRAQVAEDHREKLGGLHLQVYAFNGKELIEFDRVHHPGVPPEFQLMKLLRSARSDALKK